MAKSKVKKETIQEVVTVNTEEVVENIKETSIWLRLILVVIFYLFLPLPILFFGLSLVFNFYLLFLQKNRMKIY
tara:strand:- start:100 stop:321 length:222 start_codon:yes stop_codon:yes gene_type:complete